MDIAVTAPPVLEAVNLARRFGRVQAVRGLSFTMNRGQVLGFIGANGAGKTTTMRILSTLDIPDSGVARVAGHNVLEHPRQVRRLLGWMPDHFGAYPNMDVWEYLDFYARAMELSGAVRRERVREVMDFTELSPLADRPSNRLSKGQNQRLCLARALLNDPDVLILDEPAAGLDPKARLEFKNLVRLLAGQGKSIFISSHILSELGEMCDSLLFIDQGKMVHHGSAESLRYNDGQMAVLVRVAGSADLLLQWVAGQTNVRIREEVRNGAMLEIEGQGDDALRALLRQLVADGVPVTEFQRAQQRLEEAFIGILRQKQSAESNPGTLPPQRN